MLRRGLYELYMLDTFFSVQIRKSYRTLNDCISRAQGLLLADSSRPDAQTRHRKAILEGLVELESIYEDLAITEQTPRCNCERHGTKEDGEHALNDEPQLLRSGHQIELMLKPLSLCIWFEDIFAIPL